MAVGYCKKIIILLAIICNVLFVNACSNDISPFKEDLPIRELCSYNEQHTPSALHYSYIGDEVEEKEVTIYDKDIIERTLSVILDTKVLKQGCQVDMCVYKDVTYEYVYDDHTLVFSFTPYSYFEYDGQSHEITESQIRSLSYLFDDVETESPDIQSSTAGDIPEIETNFIDNGDEARSVTVITVHTENGDVEGYIEGAYDILSITKETDYYDIEYLYGDFYSHEEKRHSRITIADGVMVITDLD